MIKLNNYQTPLDEKLQAAIPKQIWSQLLDYIETVPFIQHLIAHEEVRGYAKDRPRDKSGKILIDITKPHILEDLDFFRERALFFNKNGTYTHIPKNPNPKSEYANFWREELRRWKHGLVRESDGEWIPGSLYFYWNYSRIWLVEKSKDEKGNISEKKGERKKDFPKPYLGDYLFYHYIEQAKAEGKHGKMLKSRGIGASFKFASMSPCNMYTLPGSGNPNFHLASDSSFLKGDKGIWGKILDNLDWISENTPLPKMRLYDRRSDMEIQLGVQDEYGSRKGLLTSVYGISLKDNPDKARGIRGPLIHYEEDGLFPNLEKAWGVNREATEEDGIAYGFMCGAGCVCAGTKVWNNKGDLVNIEDLNPKEGILGFNRKEGKISKENITYWQPPTKKDCYRITTNTGRFLECSDDHPILWSKLAFQYTPRMRDENGKYLNKRNITKKTIFKEAKDIVKGDQIAVINSNHIFGNKEMWNPRVVGWLVGDGSYGFDKTPVLSNCDLEINNYIEKHLDTVTEKSYTTQDNRIYKETRIRKICPILRQLGIYGQTKLKKTLPKDIHSYKKEHIIEFLAGFFDADGNITKQGRICLSSMSFNLMQEVQFLLQKLKIQSNITRVKKSTNQNKRIVDKNDYFRLEIAKKDSVLNFVKLIKLFPKHKQERLDSLPEYYKNKKNQHTEKVKGIVFEKVTKVEYIGKKDVYNLTAGNTNTYISNGIVTHNTGGVTGSSFEGSEKLFYKPNAYNIYGIKNVFDKNANGNSECGFFWGAYLNKGSNTTFENGECDVIRGIVSILMERKRIADSSNDPAALTQKKAELPITPQESIMRTDGTLFPIGDLKDYLSNISPNLQSFVAEHYVGELSINEGNLIKFKPNADLHAIREFPASDTFSKEGAIEIFELPKGDQESIPRFRYIAGADPVDDDHSTTNSLASIFIFDILTDRIVAEYTGRPTLANEYYEKCYRLLKFYNAVLLYENDKKGLFTYFSNRHLLHYLADTPQILKDMEMVKGPSYGNKAKGFNSGKVINAYGRRLQADWMLSPAYGEEETGLLNLHKIRSVGYIKEAIGWNIDGNFDRVSAMIGVMLLREEYYKHKLQMNEEDYRNPKPSLANDPFFEVNYQSDNSKFLATEEGKAILNSMKYKLNLNEI